ncbi:3-hydroxyacyl-ACP dehydratase FabZ family protein [Streptomyces sp. NPDC086783]|jgi:3-hydroxyacyl-[acyl-carrier-protein] dehydratase|uniref:3-hydroxyacyl-ACP dehydratase FabZ family protein n=1 Tax=Streptomyces sp. NPDC086783 TaxID=3365758 RepID=UPI00381B6B8A
MLEYADIRGVIPHAHPMLLVDRVVEWEPYDRIVTLKAVTGSEPCYAGLAPGAPRRAFAYPPSLLMESWGQGGAILWMRRVDERGERGGAPILAASRDMTFHREVFPGDTLRHVVRVDQYSGSSVIMSGESYVGDDLVAEIGYAIAVLRPAEELTWGAA